MGTVDSNLQDIMKQFLAIALCFLAVGVFSQDTTPVCTEADHGISYTTCQLLVTQCDVIVSACDGNNACLDLVSSVYDTYVSTQAAALSAISDCECEAFTCDGGSNNSAVGLGASMIMAFVAKLLL